VYLLHSMMNCLSEGKTFHYESEGRRFYSSASCLPISCVLIASSHGNAYNQNKHSVITAMSDRNAKHYSYLPSN
jgi:hypothetical protein